MNKTTQKHSDVKLSIKRACKELYPWEYTTEEGGVFREWTAGPITVPQLRKAKLAAKGSTVEVNGVLVHCLIFETASAGHGNYARWDCINGWTTTIATARKRWPAGHHAEPIAASLVSKLTTVETLKTLLTEVEYSQWLANKTASLEFYNNLPVSRCIQVAFYWAESPQGHDYWSTIYNRVGNALRRRSDL